MKTYSFDDSNWKSGMTGSDSNSFSDCRRHLICVPEFLGFFQRRNGQRPCTYDVCIARGVPPRQAMVLISSSSVLGGVPNTKNFEDVQCRCSPPQPTLNRCWCSCCRNGANIFPILAPPLDFSPIPSFLSLFPPSAKYPHHDSETEAQNPK